MEKAMCAVLVVGMVVVALAPPQAEAAISCNTMANYLMPCLNFVMYGGMAPPANCCEGIRSLYNQASTTADRQAVCSCLKSVAGNASGTMIENARALPGKCGVSIPYEIKPDVDCSKIQ